MVMKSYGFHIPVPGPRVLGSQFHRPAQAQSFERLADAVAITDDDGEHPFGVQVLCRATAKPGVDGPAVHTAYRAMYRAEPFVRIVAQKRGNYRYPEPKILAGSNYCDVGFVLDRETGQLLAIGALDNLVKGGAGNAVQSMNVRLGLDERLGLDFAGLHPV